MPITCLRNKGSRLLMFLLLVCVAVSNVLASGSFMRVDKNNGRVHVMMSDGSGYDLTLPADAEGIFYDKYKHQIEGNAYVSVFQVSPSNSDKPDEFCGAGSEVWLSVYKVVGTRLIAQVNVLVSSCLRSISMTSQNTGEENQETDFSSVKWHTAGFSIDWFSNVDSAGRPLSSTSYRLRNTVFSPQEVVGQ
jgi:hypothetical protein